MSGADDFKRQIEAEFAEKQTEIRKYVVKIADYAIVQIQQLSPVDTGRFRANWNSAIGVPDPHTTLETDKISPATTARMKAKVAEYVNFKTFPPIYLTNGLPYALALENGYSKQAASGVVSVALAKTSMKFARFSL